MNIGVEILYEIWALSRSSELVNNHVSDKHKGEKEHSEVANNLARDGLSSAHLVVGVGVLDVGKKNLFIPNLIVFSFLIILQGLSLKMLQDLHEAAFVRSSDAIEDVHVDNVILVERDVILHEHFSWN